MDSNRWVEVTGTVVHDRGLVRIEGTRIAATTAPTEAPPSQRLRRRLPRRPSISSSSPSDDETDVSPSGPVRVQFSRGVREASLAGRVIAGYSGPRKARRAPTWRQSQLRRRQCAVEIRFAAPLEPFRTVEVRLLDGIVAFDGGPLKPWSLSFSVGAP